MAAQSYEFTGKTTDEAIADGLKTLKLRQDQVDIEVLNKGSRGIFGIGSEPAQVRLTLRSTGVEEQPAKPVAPVIAEPVVPQSNPTPTTTSVLPSATGAEANITTPLPATEEQAIPAEIQAPAPILEDVAAPVATLLESTPLAETALEPAVTTLDPATDNPATEEVLAQLAVELLTKMIQLMGFQGEVTATWQTGDSKTGEYEEAYLLLDVRGADLGALIGRRGETLDNIQYLLRLMINQRLRQWKNIVVDVEQYKARRLTQLTQLAMRMAEQVTNSGRAVSLEPMPPNERRVVHLALRDHPTVYTESTGDGERRKVNIVAK
ncbi:MAG: Jag N-terminal domain-containing protein [Chloroflexi bacterium]|nr:Jag N-terminal domain-containing protein [Chloroflexota bacterium]